MTKTFKNKDIEKKTGNEIIKDLLENPMYKEVRETANKIDAKIREKIRIIVLTAPVKSGKRKIAETCMINLKELNEINCVHIFTSVLHKKADANQRKELDETGFIVLNMRNKTCTDKLIELIEDNINDCKIVIIHLDELDYGSKETQIMSKLYTKFAKNKQVYFIKYSATPYDAMPDFVDNSVKQIIGEPHVIEHEPPENYFGIRQYIEAGRFKQAKKLYDIDYSANGEHELSFTDEFERLVQELKDNYKNNKPCFGFLRVVGSKQITTIIDGKKKRRNIQDVNVIMNNMNNIEKEYGISIKFSGDNSKANNIKDCVEWDSERYWNNEKILPRIYIVQNTASRSTEMKCHHLFAWVHEYRNRNASISTIIQSQERFVGFNIDKLSIVIYGDLNAAKCSAEMIAYKDFKERQKISLSSNVSIKNTSNEIKVNFKTFNHNEKNKAKKFILKQMNEYHENHEEYFDKNDNKKQKQTEEQINKLFNNRFNEHWGKKETLVEKYNKKAKKNIKYQNYYIDENGYHKTSIRGIQDRRKWYVDELLHENGGINKNNLYRIHPAYQDDNCKPEEYTIVIRYYNGFKEINTKNKSIYSSQTLLTVHNIPKDIGNILEKRGIMPIENEFMKMNKFFKSLKSEKLHELFNSNPELWSRYHEVAEYYNNKNEVHHTDFIIKRLRHKKYRNKPLSIADLGCGITPIQNRMDFNNLLRFTNIDHYHSDTDNNVIKCDILNITDSVNYNTFDVVIMSLSMWGDNKNKNNTKYLEVIKKILKENGELIIVEPVKRWCNGKGNELHQLLQKNDFRIKYAEEDDENDGKYQNIICELI